MWQLISLKAKHKKQIQYGYTGERTLALKLMYITNNPEVALIAEKNGVDRIWVDLESEGKEERQKGQNSVKSNHTIKDIEAIAPLLTTSEMLVRINPWSERSVKEVNRVIRAGAELIMLPMWKTTEEVERFVRCINGRCKTILLLETKEAVECLDDVLKIPGIDEIHIGLNDLHLSYQLTFMFEPLINGIIENIVKKIKNTDIPYGFGGIARIGEGDIPAEMIILEHYRLGSTRAILSRSFCSNMKIDNTEIMKKMFLKNIGELREFEKKAEKTGFNKLEDNHKKLFSMINEIIK